MFLHLDLSRNLHYDRLTRVIIDKVLTNNSRCIDVGCHKGEIMDIMLEKATEGGHYAVEPIPEMADALRRKYDGRVEVFDCALSDHVGTTDFQWVKNAPAYSGIRKRAYAIPDPVIEKLQVPLNTLDNIIPNSEKIDFIKIDVEGAELAVLRGAKNLLKHQKPVVLFECGLGASDYYQTNPEELFDYLCAVVGLKLFLLKDFVAGRPPMEQQAFLDCYHSNSEYYFVAAP